MKNLWQELKTFALAGNMVDLAIGFIIGAAFTAVVESLAGDVILGAISTFVGDQSYTEWAAGDIAYGKFLAQVVNFVIVAAVLFGLVKLLRRAGVGNFRAQGQRECPYCREFVAVDAVRCRWCTSKLRAYIDEEEGAEERIDA